MNLLYIQLFPFTFVDPSTNLPMASGWVSVKLAGTATNATTYTTATGTSNANPTQLNAAGRGTFYFDPVNAGTSGQLYDVFVYADADSGLTTPILTFEDVAVPVAASTGNATSAVIGFGSPTTLTIAGGSITPTKDFHLVSPEGGASDNLDTIATTSFPDGGILVIANTNGSAAITVRHNVGNIQTYNAENIVMSATRQMVPFIRSGSNFYEFGGISSSLPTSNDVVNGRLTLTSGVPVPTADQTGALILVYFTPYKGKSIDLYNVSSSSWERLSFSETSRAVPNAANKLYDCFMYNNGGVANLYTDITLQWTNNNTRAVALTLQDGVLVMSGSPQYRYVGTIATSAVAGRAIDTYAERKVYNYYNRVRRPIRKLYSEASWSYNIAAFENWNGATTNGIEIVQGVVEDAIDLRVHMLAAPSAADQTLFAAFADAASPTILYTGAVGYEFSGSTAASLVSMTSALQGFSPLGFTNYSGVFRGTGTGTVTWYGSGAASGIEGGIFA